MSNMQKKKKQNFGESWDKIQIVIIQSMLSMYGIISQKT